MAGFVLMVLLLAMAAPSRATWCVCREGLSDTALQKTLDYACGSGADCNPTHQNGPCFNPNTVRAHCSYAVNSYFQRYRQSPTACDFSGTAMVVTSDPSAAGCSYPATASATTTPVTTTTPVGGTSTTTTTGGGTSGALGGANNGLSPSGINTDMSFGGILMPKSILLHSSLILTFIGLLF